MDDLLLGYVLDALDPAETAAVEAHLRAHPKDEAKVEKLRRVLAPLAADRGGYDPPPGLAAATLARLAEQLVAAEADRPRPRVRSALADVPLLARRRIEAVVAAAIAFLTVGIVLAGLQKVRRDTQVAACQNNLRVLYAGLTQYADDHGGQYPQVGAADAPTAGAFVVVLVEAGRYPDGLRLVCPAAPAVPPEVDGFRPDPLAPPGPAVVERVGYAYTLGYRGPNGELLGLRRGDALTDDHTPLAADLPAKRVAPPGGPVSPHGRGQNVLYADGHVQFWTVATVGPGGDDIYRNADGLVRAGRHRFDAALGRATDEP
jgi:prepilin-type processing-associated H-X9-DG protein